MGDRGPAWAWRKVGADQSRQLLAERLERFFGARAGRGKAVVVEVGCGDGRVTEILSEHVPHGRSEAPTLLVALDIDLQKLAVAARRFHPTGSGVVRLVAASLYDLPFPAGAIRYLVALNVGYLIDRARFLRRATEVLTSDGQVLFYDLIPKDENKENKEWLPVSFSMTRDQLPRSRSGSTR
jgi:ubiquinone/menaquinone biosynthesis C-methylase UbiE